MWAGILIRRKAPAAAYCWMINKSITINSWYSTDVRDLPFITWPRSSSRLRSREAHAAGPAPVYSLPFVAAPFYVYTRQHIGLGCPRINTRNPALRLRYHVPICLPSVQSDRLSSLHFRVPFPLASGLNSLFLLAHKRHQITVSGKCKNCTSLLIKEQSYHR